MTERTTFKALAAAGVIAGFAATSGVATATPSSSGPSSVDTLSSITESDFDTFGAVSCSNTTLAANTFASQCSTDNAAFSAGSTVVNALVSAAVTSLVTSSVSTRIGNVLAGGGSFGAPAGVTGDSGQAGAMPIGVWANVGWTRFEDQNAGAESDGDAIIGTLGGDYRVTDQLLVGAALNYENVEVTTTFNSGEVEMDGFSLIPYIGYQIDQVFSVTVLGGYTWGELDQFRTDQVDNSRITSSTDYSRWFLSGSANANTVMNNVTLGGSLGLMYGVQTVDGFTETDADGAVNGTAGTATNTVGEAEVETGVVSLSGRIGYLAPVDFGFVEPYAKLGYSYEFVKDKIDLGPANQQHANGRNRIAIGGGVALYTNGGASGSIDLEHGIKEDQNDTTLSATFRMQF